MRSVFSALLVLAFTVQVSWADNLPSLGGDTAQESLTPTQEREIGEGAMREIRRSGELAEDPELVAYLNRLGARLVEAAGVSDSRYTFFPVLDNTVNAFAIPGGFVGVHTGVIVMAQRESELASGRAQHDSGTAQLAEQREQAQSAIAQAQAELDAAQAEYDQAMAQRSLLEAQLEQARAAQLADVAARLQDIFRKRP